MYKILIIGAGQLGSRHLQGVLSSNIRASIEVVDPSDLSIKNAMARSLEINYDKNKFNIYFYHNLDQISKEIDLCIIASTADNRFDIISSLLTRSKVKNLILEKILFQSINEYDIIDKLLNLQDVKTWVNCPRRIIPEYQAIKSQIKIDENISLSILGSNWGLACNSIHFLDLFNYFTDEDDFSINSIGKVEVINAKRNNFYEISGSIIITEKLGSSLFLKSIDLDTTFLEIILLTNSNLYRINESKGIIENTNIHLNTTTKYNFKFPLQSEMSGLLAEEILLKSFCNLTPYGISSKLHKQLINNYIQYFPTEVTKNGKLCPIT